MRRIFSVLFLGLMAASFMFQPAFAQDKKEVYKFWSKYCPHCKDENVYLDKLIKERNDFEIKSYEVTSDKKAADLFEKFSDKYGNSGYNVPVLFIGEKMILGFKNEETTGPEIITALDSYTIENYPDPAKFVGIQQEQAKPEAKTSVIRKIPFIGEVDFKNYSIPALTIILGTVDGFNPCAMWALLALLTLLVSMGSRKRVLVIGGTFVFTSWLITFLFLSAFLNVFSLLKFDLIIRLIIGIVAVYTAYQLFLSFRKETEECKVTTGKGKVYKQIEKLSQTSFLPYMFLGAIGLALLVNMVEFMCSINLPIVFTKVLSMADLPRWQHYLYIALYDVFYMLDDIIVLIIALVSLKAFSGFNKKYSRFTKLVGAIVMGLLGITILFFPNLLSF